MELEGAQLQGCCSLQGDTDSGLKEGGGSVDGEKWVDLRMM